MVPIVDPGLVRVSSPMSALVPVISSPAPSGTVASPAQDVSLALGEAEVENLELVLAVAALDYKDVCGFDVAMDDAAGVGGGHGACRLLGEGDGFGRGYLVVGQVLFESLAVEKLHHQVGLAVLLADVVNGADIGMIQG